MSCAITWCGACYGRWRAPPGGDGGFDHAALQRLCFVRAALEAGIGLDLLTRLCRALDAADGDEASARLADLCQ